VAAAIGVSQARTRLTARVEGRVQGVGYRYWVRERAATLGLVGWVMNAPDERAVELVVEGPEPAIATLERALWQGPSGARIDRVDARRSAPSGEYRFFSITRP